MHSPAGLRRDLAQAGLDPSATVLVHSSMKSIGAVAGGADGVLDALIGSFGGRGLLLMPALSWDLNAAAPEFDVLATPTQTGILTELFRRRPGVIRSLHPTHSMAGTGTGAAAFLAGHEAFDTPCAPGSPWGRLAEAGAVIAFIGAPLTSNTMIHGLEERAGVPGILTTEAEMLYVTASDGRRFAVPSRRHTYEPERSQFYGKMEADFLAAGALRTARFGDAPMRLLDAGKAARTVLARLAADPGYFTRP